MSSLLLSSCATVFHGSNQSVTFTAVDEETKQDLNHVSCNVTDSSGTIYHIKSNPDAVMIPKGNAPLQIKCDKNGYENYTGSINDSFDSLALLDILFWPTFFVDIATGAIKKYPGHYAISMDPIDNT
jgi:hypothetical protein